MMSLVRAALSVIPRPRPDRLPGISLDKRITADREHLAAYQRVCHFRLSDRLPITYPHILGFDLAMDLMTRSDFPFPVIGLVHVNNRIEQQRQLTADDSLTVNVRASDLREHPRGTQFDVTTTVEVDGEPVWREASTYLRVTRRGQGKHAEGAQMPAPHAVWRIGPQAGTAYAKVSGDHNPIHTSRLGARLFGFPRPIAHGMWSKARCLAALEGRLPEKLTVDVAFKRPILLPAKVGFAFTDQFALFDARTGRPHVIGRIPAAAAPTPPRARRGKPRAGG